MTGRDIAPKAFTNRKEEQAETTPHGKQDLDSSHGTSEKHQKESTRKRKADVLGRLNNSQDVTFHQGRGALVGWTTCPLCGRHSRKRYALGRGIASHLHAVHTPWNPGKVERKKRRRFLERQQGEEQQKRHGNLKKNTPCHHQIQHAMDATWEPTEQERHEWNEKVLEIVADVETKAMTEEAARDGPNNTVNNKKNSLEFVPKGLDRNGKVAVQYRKSLPPFLQAAANGELQKLQEFVQASSNVGDLLDTRDRNGSTAQHWAAGEGHLQCLKYMCEVQSPQESPLNQQNELKETSKDESKKKRMRRRDGKTSLHYAARNGHLDCIQYLLENEINTVNVPSGDGTTPLHMACYGGHVHAIRLLLQQGADGYSVNDWGCGVCHWIGMTRKKHCRDETWKLCNMLQDEYGVNFGLIQKQGHSVLHKAAQHLNRHVIEWVAAEKEQGGAGLSCQQRERIGLTDKGGHTPSDIWRSVGGDESFAQWIKERGW